MTDPSTSTPQPLARAQFHVLLALADGPRHGWAIREHAAALSGGAVRLGPGTLYEAMERLEERGLIEETATPAGESEHAQRRYYAITGAGLTALRAELGRLGEVLRWAESRGLGSGGAG